MQKELFLRKATDVFDKGAQVQFEDAEVEAPSRLLEKEDGSKIKKVKLLISK